MAKCKTPPTTPGEQIAPDMLSAHIEVKRCLTERGDDGGVLQQLKTSKEIGRAHV